MPTPRTTPASTGGSAAFGVLGLNRTRAELSETTVEDTAAGVGLGFWDSQATVSGSVIARNTVGLHLFDSSALREVAALSDALEPSTVLVTTDTRFVDNATRLGSGAMPLPDLPSALTR